MDIISFIRVKVLLSEAKVLKQQIAIHKWFILDEI